MAYRITEACALCGACAWECPAGAVAEEADRSETSTLGFRYVIDPDKCVGCGRCVAACQYRAVDRD